MVVAPPWLQWPDRRPIGAIFLASHDHVSPGNPRGWFNDPSLDTRTTSGRATFASTLQRYADQSVANLKTANAQGVIVWDIEGQEYPHKTTYIGAPQMVEALAPEMGDAVDAFFRTFRRAGFRVGVTVRPQRLTAVGGRMEQVIVPDYSEVLEQKITYAYRRWGATLFYIDSNAGPRSPLEWMRFQRLHKHYQDILLVPEHYHPLYWMFSAPLCSATDRSLAVRWMYPSATVIVNVADAQDSPRIRAAVTAGDILLFRAWFASPELTLVSQYQQLK